jgi:hypothetical protein
VSSAIPRKFFCHENSYPCYTYAMSKNARRAAKAGAKIGRPKGTGAGYTEVVRVLLTPETLKELEAWKQRTGAPSLSEAVRRMVDQVLRAEGERGRA